MRGRPPIDCSTVRCNCDGLQAKATFEVDGGFLILSSPFGETRVPLGIQEPRKLAKKLFKNICVRGCKTTGEMETFSASAASR